VLCLAREKWGEGQGGHLNAEKEDWAPLYGMDKLDQLILFVFHHSFTRRLMVSSFFALIFPLET
jgi:hypothetical protein